jgi:ketosteroid isomerase-like protein
MVIELPAPVSAFFEVSNRHDAEAVADRFTPDALVHDENADHRGRAAIRDWAAQTHRKFAARLTPRDARTEGSVSIVRTSVAGTFPGSPIDLEFRFTTRRDSIAELIIG